jgi:alpha-D-ribose 1-methylphosphonate 5-triphosphate diphosphatase
MSNRMSSEQIFTNGRVVTRDAEFDGTVVVRDGRIVEVASGRAACAAAVDLEGDYLVPGLVELHTDNMEKHFSPRPGVQWPSIAAVMAHDTQIAAAGITTVFDSLSLGDVRGDTDRVKNRTRMVEAICAVSERRLARAEHRLHLRCEVTPDDAVQAVDRWIDLPLVGLISINDHTPGQRQFLDPAKLKQYYMGKFAMTEEQFEVFHARALELHSRNAARHRHEIVARAQARALPLASHDDATRAHVEQAVENGMTIAEFPTTREAAEASREGGLAVLVGAPNLVLGGSHSGNIAAIDLLRDGQADILSSDYVPASLMESVFRLPTAGIGIGLPEAVRLASLNPAQAVGLADRGEIAADRRADFVRVRHHDDAPLVRAVWREGERVV